MGPGQPENDPSDAALALGREVHEVLLARGETVGCAESLTGGELAMLLSGTPGASATFVGGVVCYATSVKRRLLGVTAERVVSAECAEEMATGLRGLLEVDWALSATGNAGPGRQEEEPVGTVYVAVAGRSGTRGARLDLDGSRREIRAAAGLAASRLLLDEVSRA